MNNTMRLFETDRRMELKLRLAAKRAAEFEKAVGLSQRWEGQILEEVLEVPEGELKRLIERVRSL
ncbi:MAG: hypothetical protein ACRDHY_08635 [Anaerolineales bacterium]